MAIVNSYTEAVPTPDRTSLDEIVAAAAELLERDGLAGLTMNAVAERVGVRAPSLYKRVESRDHLIELVAEATLTYLIARLGTSDDPMEMLNTLRALGHERPVAFQLVMTPGAGAPRPRSELAARASEPVLRLGRRLAGEEHALEAARTVTAWATGFISMELNSGFNLGGDVDSAWEFGATRVLRAIAS